MVCYECSLAGKQRDAVGLCHHCSAALCTEHAQMVADEITTQVPVVKTIVLPRKARLLLCQICRAAIEQPHLEGAVRQDECRPEAAHELIVH
jgi:hypothetical protein